MDAPTPKYITFKHSVAIRDACMYFSVQRAARAVTRRFDDALRAHDLTAGQFALLLTLNRPGPARISEIASLFVMDRTTLTANLKPLERRGLINIGADEKDRRRRLLELTPQGSALLYAAYPAWQRAQAETERLVSEPGPERLRDAMTELY